MHKTQIFPTTRPRAYNSHHSVTFFLALGDLFFKCHSHACIKHIVFMYTFSLPIFFLITDVSQALSRLTEPVPYNLPSLGTVVTRATSKLQMRPEEAPIPVTTLNEILLVMS